MYARGSDRRFVAGAICLQSRRTCAEPPAGGGLVGHRDFHGARRIDVLWGHRAMVACHGRLERRRRAAKPGHEGTPLQLQGMVVLQNKQCRNCHALEGIGGRRGPDLSWRRHPPHTRSVDRPNQQRHARRRQHARLWQADQAGRDERPGRFSGQPAPAGQDLPVRPRSPNRDDSEAR